MLAVTGMLNELAHDLDVSIGQAGQLNTAFAIAVAVCAPLLGVATSKIDRRSLLIAALTLYALLHFAAAFAPSFFALLLLRLVAGLSPAIYTPQAAATAGLLVPTERRGAAISTVFLGFSVATVAGLPLGAYIGSHFGWRTTMIIIGCMSVLMVVWLRFSLPARLTVQALDLRAFADLVRDRVLVLLVAVTAAQSAAQFVLFSYIAPALKSSVHASPGVISALLAAFGVFGVIGNALGARYMDRLGSSQIVLFALLSMLAGLLLWPLSIGNMMITVIAIALWGFGCFAVNSAQQVRLVVRNPRLAPVSVSFNSSAIYFGQAIGTVVGAAIIAKWSINHLSWAGAAIFLIAIACSILAQQAAAAPARATA